MSGIENNHSSNTEVGDIGVKSYISNDEDKEKFEFFFFLKTYNHINLSRNVMLKIKKLMLYAAKRLLLEWQQI